MSETTGVPGTLPPPPRKVLTKAKFLLNAHPVRVIVAGKEMQAQPMKFKTGSLGYHAAGKLMLPVGDLEAQVQVNVMLTVVHSRQMPEE